MEQSFESHAHRPWAFIISTAAIIAAVIFLIMAWAGRNTMRPAVACLVVVALANSTTSRTYTTALQDRIIRMEMLYRTDKLLSPAARARYATLSLKQVIALRFASDAELPGLVERAANEKLDPRAIKQAIKDWQADLVRT